MSSGGQFPFIATVWRFKDIASAIFHAAHLTGTKAIFDISHASLDSAFSALSRVDDPLDSADLKISPEQLLNPAIENFAHEIRLGGLWVELHPALLNRDPLEYLERICELSLSVKCYPVIGDVHLIDKIITDFVEIPGVALKGCESSGFVSSESIFTLHALFQNMTGRMPKQTNPFIWGGVATPEAAAAFIASGAKGVILESLHWLTDLVDLDATARNGLLKLRPEHTSLVGSNLQSPCRFFNRGNSRAVKKQRDLSSKFCGTDVTQNHRKSFAEQVQAEMVHPLDSGFSADELLPLGVEAAFASSFIERFGVSTVQSLDRFVYETNKYCRQAPDQQAVYLNSQVAREMGTKYPFLQGAMTWITDVPEFAVKVAEAGALPTLALGMQSRTNLNIKLAHIKEIMGDYPYAVNIITLQENPHRQEQLDWIIENKPRFAVIAAGDPSSALPLLETGIDVIYLAPNLELLRLAFEAGVKYVVCEGNEAGGHVGEHSTLTLAQMILDFKTRNPSLFEGRRVILAGGICNRLTAFMAAMLGADGIQMGTCYLATREIVETGALSLVYQRCILESGPGGTIITGEKTGLRVRSLLTSKIEAICALEREFDAGAHEDEVSFRLKMEGLSAGSLFVAARGLDGPGGPVLEEDAHLRQGQFMSGACASLLDRVVSLEELHLELSEGLLPPGLPYSGPLGKSAEDQYLSDKGPQSVNIKRISPVRQSRHPVNRERIAITGLSIVNSLGLTPQQIWESCLASKSGITSVPLSRWDHSLYFDPRPRAREKTYCKYGAFQEIEISRKDIDVPPQDFRTMTDSTRITLWLARNAIEDSGIMNSNIPRPRISVLSSQNSGEAAGTLGDVIVRASANRIVSSIKPILALSGDKENALIEALKSDRLEIDDTTLLGRLNCASGGFICNKYGFRGPSFAVSAACATSLVALYSAYQMIRNGIIDAAIVGGAEEPLTPMHFLEFSALGALAGISDVNRPPEQASRPFDKDRDGMVLGEGGAMIVIERESVAKSRGARIYGYITGVGASNNDLGLVESSSITQELAIGASFDDTYYGPEDVDLVECHATSTIQGDIEEVRALRKFFKEHSRTVLSSFKSQIGHTLGASGLNSLIRAVMAMSAGVFPPTLNCEKPDEALKLEHSGLEILSDADDWKPHRDRPRRFEVNAFGFGGSNYVIQVEESMADDDTILVSNVVESRTYKDHSLARALPDILNLSRIRINGEPCRLGVVSGDQREVSSLIDDLTRGDDARVHVETKALRNFARKGIFIGRESDRIPNVAFVFPGQGSHYKGMGLELYESFPTVRKWMDRAAKIADFDILNLIFFDSEEDLQKTRWQQPALFSLEYAMAQYFLDLGVKSEAMAGHSLGELTALCLAGVYSFEDGFRIVNKRAVCMDKACGINQDPGVMVAVDAPVDYLVERIGKSENVFITNINSPKQTVIGGGTEAVTDFAEELKKEGYRRTRLKVSMAFHSPIMSCIRDELEEFISDIRFYPPVIPVISNTTSRPYPSDPQEIKRILMDHLESPVHWMDNVKTLLGSYDTGIFLEIGPRDILCNLIADTSPDVDCIYTCMQGAEKTTYCNALARLYASGRFAPEHVACASDIPNRDPVQSVRTTVDDSQARALRHTLVSPEGIAPELYEQITSFLADGVGRFLKPALLEAIRREHDPQFSEQRLDSILGSMFPAIARKSLPRASLKVQDPGQLQIQDIMLSPENQKAESQGADKVTKTVIEVLVNATGYEIHEVAPHMDLREDLSIRSSRLPVIMESLEEKFGIRIDLEDFVEVRTVGGIADKIREIVGDDSGYDSFEKTSSEEQLAVQEMAGSSALQERLQPLRRIIFEEVNIPVTPCNPCQMVESDEIIILAATESDISLRLANTLKTDCGIDPSLIGLLGSVPGAPRRAFDLRNPEDSAKVCGIINNMNSLAGLIFIVDGILENELPVPDDLLGLLTGSFNVIKSFLKSSRKKFSTVLNFKPVRNPNSALYSEGLLGMFLSLTHEYGSVQFRAISIEDQTDLSCVVKLALDREWKIVENFFSGTEILTKEGTAKSLVWARDEKFGISRDDVVVFSGGGRGITTYLARALLPFGNKTVFLGRTGFDPTIDYESLLIQKDNLSEAILERISRSGPITGRSMETKIREISGGVEIARNVEYLRSLGGEASYYTCDVTDPESTERVMSQLLTRYGKVDAVVHGAGIIRDNLFESMTTKDFSEVMRTKVQGAWNLYRAVEKQGISFFGCLSSGAAIQGNPGQANYSAANRMMSGLMTELKKKNPSVRFESIHLPPIEGAGMADDPQIRALMKRMHVDYVHAVELGALFARELKFGNPDETSVLFMRSLPDLKSVRLAVSSDETEPETLEVGTVKFSTVDFPMIQSVENSDLVNGILLTSRSFSIKNDLWITDHKPFKFLRHPLVSAIMVIETCMEAAKLFAPHLQILGFQDAGFVDKIECAPDETKTVEILLKQNSSSATELVCDVSMSSRLHTFNGRSNVPSAINYEVKIIMGNAPDLPVILPSGFPVLNKDLDSRPMSHDEVTKWYQNRTDLTGNYRVIREMHGSGPDAIRGVTVYHEGGEFADPPTAVFQYSPYLLEALLHVCNFYVIMRNEEEKRSMIPYGIGKMNFYRKCLQGEKITLHGRLKDSNEQGLVWDAIAVDENEKMIMKVQNVVMRWFSSVL